MEIKIYYVLESDWDAPVLFTSRKKAINYVKTIFLNTLNKNELDILITNGYYYKKDIEACFCFGDVMTNDDKF